MFAHNNYVIRKLVLSFLFFALIVGVFPSHSYSAAQLPPTAEGPGFILPNSPLFFLDKVKQDLRIALALTPSDKAKVYNSIAGERYAELRYMIAKDSKDGIQIALSGVSDNLNKAAESLSQAQFDGVNVETLSENINNDIKRRQEGLDILLSQSQGDLKTAVLGTQTSIYDSKTKVVNGLAPDKKENELKSDQQRQTESNIKNGPVCSREMVDKLANYKSRIEEIVGTNEEKKKALSSAYDKLLKAGAQCVEANKAFQAAFEELNKLLKTNNTQGGSTVQESKKVPLQYPIKTPETSTLRK